MKKLYHDITCFLIVMDYTFVFRNSAFSLSMVQFISIKIFILISVYRNSTGLKTKMFLFANRIVINNYSAWNYLSSFVANISLHFCSYLFSDFQTVRIQYTFQNNFIFVEQNCWSSTSYIWNSFFINVDSIFNFNCYSVF